MHIFFQSGWFTKVLFVGLFAIAGACSTEIVFPDRPGNQILSYKVETAEGFLHGAIDQEKKTITIYLPFYYNFSIIDPIIELTNGAKLLGTHDVVEVDQVGYTYTVEGQDKTTNTYTLVVEIQQVRPLWVRATGASVTVGGNLNISGNFNTKNPADVKLTVVGSDGVEIPLSTIYTPSVTPAADNTYVIGGYLAPKSLELDKEYRVRARIRGQQADSDPLALVLGRPNFNNLYPYVETRVGQEFTVYSYVSVFTEPKRVYVTIDGVDIPITVVSYDREKMVLKLPVGVPLGTHFTARADFEGYTNVQLIFTVVE